MLVTLFGNDSLKFEAEPEGKANYKLDHEMLRELYCLFADGGTLVIKVKGEKERMRYTIPKSKVIK